MTSPVTYLVYLGMYTKPLHTMYSDEEIYIEPELGQTVSHDIDDYNDKAYQAYRARETTFIQDMEVRVIKYSQLEPLGFCQGHRARVSILRV